MSTTTAKKPGRPDVQIKIKLIPLDCGVLRIETKYGPRTFSHGVEIEMSKEEADELIKVRSQQRRESGRDGCDIILAE